jgi:hypothetical protein
VNAIELSQEETYIVKIGLADSLGVEKEFITDETALKRILSLNKDLTIERIN